MGIDKSLTKLNIDSIRPRRWLSHQCNLLREAQQKMMLGSDMLIDGKWQGGETFPRYLRGLILLSAVLDDAKLRLKADTLMKIMLDQASEGGDINLKNQQSMTPKIEAIKTALVYYNLTSDTATFDFIYKFLRFCYGVQSISKNSFLSKARQLELAQVAFFVKEKTGENWLSDFVSGLSADSYDWIKVAKNFKLKKPASSALYGSPNSLKKVLRDFEDGLSLSKTNEILVEQIKRSTRKNVIEHAMLTDGVSIAKAVKYPAVFQRQYSKNFSKYSLALVQSLERYHSNATSMFSSSFNLNGTSPVSPIYVESVVEYIESLVDVLALTADNRIADRIEKIMFNIIPTVCLDDMSFVQDAMLVNQLEASTRRTKNGFDNRNKNAYIDVDKASTGAVAVLSAYPLYLQSLCMIKGDEISFLTYGPAEFNIATESGKIKIIEETDYPFRNAVVFRVAEADGDPEVKINFRVPQNTTMNLIAGGQVVASGSSDISVKCELKKGSTFMLKMDIPLVTSVNKDDSISLFKGSLLLSPLISNSTERDADNSTVALRVNKKWNYVPVVNKKSTNGQRRFYEEENLSTNSIKTDIFQSEQPPFVVNLRCRRAFGVVYDKNGFVQLPKQTDFSNDTTLRQFVPFACCKLHIGHLPRCTK